MAFRNYLEGEDDKPYFHLNSLAHYYEKMEGFAAVVENAAKTLNLTKEEIEQRIAERLQEWDGKLEGFDGSVTQLLTEWVDDGTFNHIIDSSLIDEKIQPLALELGEKANDAEVIKKGKGTLNDFDEPTRAVIQGIEPGEINAVLGDGNVEPRNTNFFILSKNLFDKSAVIPSTDVNNVTGATSSSDVYDLYKRNVEPSQTYTLSKGYRVGFYDQSDVFINGMHLVGVAPATLTTPANANIIRFAIHKTSADINTFMFVKGSVLPDSYEPFGADVIPKEKQEKQTGLARSNFGNEFLLNNDLPNGTDLNTVFNDGNHTGLANGNYRNLPPGFNPAKAFKINVSSLFKGGNRWATQEFTQFDDLNFHWGRVVDKNGTLLNEWQRLGASTDTKNQTKPLVEKTIAYFGDSTTEFGTIPNQVGTVTGADVHKLGFGGTRLAFHTSSQYEPFSFTNLVDAIISKEFSIQQAAIDNTSYSYSAAFKTAFELLKTLDFTLINGLVIGYGTNDYMGTTSGVVPLGQSGDNTRTTFYGAINYSIEKLHTAFPHLQIAFITPTWRENSPALGGGEVVTSPNSDGTYLVEYVDAIIEEVGNKNHIPTLDLFRRSGINKYNKAIYLGDSVHPTLDVGYPHLGKIVGSFVGNVFS